MMPCDSKWIYMNSAQCDLFSNEFVYFKKIFTCGQKGSLHIKICADSLYELYLNGAFIGRGPCRPSGKYRYYDEYTLTNDLQQGKNVLAVKALHFSGAFPYQSGIYGPTGIFRNSVGGLLVEGLLLSAEDEMDISTNNSWLYKKEPHICNIKAELAQWANNFEQLDGAKILHNFYNEDIDGWQNAAELYPSMLQPCPITDYGQHYNTVLVPRPIPPMKSETRILNRIVKTNSPQKDKIYAAAGESVYFDMDAGELETAYMCYAAHGNGRITVIYSEAYYQDAQFHKGVRDDISGEIYGDKDVLIPVAEPKEYRPMMYRTFRFIRLLLEAGDEALFVDRIAVCRTGYPLEVTGSFACSNESYNQMYQISVRTLQRCMHDTYIDCPYYEQLQYLMDTRLEALFAHQLSTDGALTRKAIKDFMASQTPGGLLQSRYPSVYPQNIPGFSIYFILLVYDYLLYKGEDAFVADSLWVIDGILNWFRQSLNEHALVATEDTWNFTDWVEGWKQSSVPPMKKNEGQTILSMQYCYGLLTAAKLCDMLNKPLRAREYRQQYKSIRQSIVQQCFDSEKNLFADGELKNSFSMHAQLWAVLAEIMPVKRLRGIIIKAQKQNILMPSYAMSFYYFRALEKVGLLKDFFQYFRPWMQMLQDHLTTWTEDPVTQRSDCHGWGGTPLYEMSAFILGITPAEKGFQKAIIKPHICGLHYAEGGVPTPSGMISVYWKVSGGLFEIMGESPVEAEIHLPDGEIHKGIIGAFQFRCHYKGSE